MAKITITLDFDTDSDTVHYVIDGVQGIAFSTVIEASIGALVGTVSRLGELTIDEAERGDHRLQ